MQREFMAKLPPRTKFFHPLPRDARFPTLPFWLDATEFNGWDQQSQNGYFTRIILLGMLSGLFGDDFEDDQSEHSQETSSPRLSLSGFSDMPPIQAAWDFIQEVPLVS